MRFREISSAILNNDIQFTKVTRDHWMEEQLLFGQYSVLLSLSAGGDLLAQSWESGINTLWPRQSGRQFPDDIFKWKNPDYILNENA